MKAKKFIINGEEHDIEGSGKPTELPGICEMELSKKTGSSHVGVATITEGEVVDGTIVIMDNSSGTYLFDVEINNVNYDVCGVITSSCYVTGIVREIGQARYIFTMDKKQKQL